MKHFLIALLALLLCVLLLGTLVGFAMKSDGGELKEELCEHGESKMIRDLCEECTAAREKKD